jgi:hypothetical protein
MTAPTPRAKLWSWVWRGAACILAGMAGIGCGTWKRQSPEPMLQASVAGGARFGPIDGFAQVPAGGAPGTTSGNRPTFDELGIDTVAAADTSVALRWGAHGLFGGAVLTELSGSSVLRRDLISRGVTFAAGTPTRSDIRLDRYRAGYRYRLMWTDEEGTTIEIAPEVGIALFDFDYKLGAAGGPSVSRNFLQASPELGVDALWHPKGHFFFAGGVHGAVPVSSLAIVSAQLTANYEFWKQPRWDGTAYVGVGYDWIDFEDSQTIPNHIRAEVGPPLVGGVRLDF